MASGCIVGECFVCGDWVFESESSWQNDKWKHSHCKTQSSLKQENELLIRELEEYKRWISTQ
ncbi:hypothetical protein PMSD_20785 [Paenibacillus macquariensis subsp. defensor]|nr:hypothetical protein PMSD_20785 [Paenibacillus macquariensis subsp. defensor]